MVCLLTGVVSLLAVLFFADTMYVITASIQVCVCVCVVCVCDGDGGDINKCTFDSHFLKPHPQYHLTGTMLG